MSHLECCQVEAAGFLVALVLDQHQVRLACQASVMRFQGRCHYAVPMAHRFVPYRARLVVVEPIQPLAVPGFLVALARDQCQARLVCQVSVMLFQERCHYVVPMAHRFVRYQVGLAFVEQRMRPEVPDFLAALVRDQRQARLVCQASVMLFQERYHYVEAMVNRLVPYQERLAVVAQPELLAVALQIPVLGLGILQCHPETARKVRLQVVVPAIWAFSGSSY